MTSSWMSAKVWKSSSDAAARQTVAPPGRRPLPPGFLRGVSYAMTNSVEDAYVAPRSLETLRYLRGLGERIGAGAGPIQQPAGRFDLPPHIRELPTHTLKLADAASERFAASRIRQSFGKCTFRNSQ